MLTARGSVADKIAADVEWSLSICRVLPYKEGDRAALAGLHPTALRAQNGGFLVNDGVFW